MNTTTIVAVIWVICAVINFLAGLAGMNYIESHSNVEGHIDKSHFVELFLTVIAGPLGTLYYIIGVIVVDRNANHKGF